MTRTPDEIKNGLECCVDGFSCRTTCPYTTPFFNADKCTKALATDALALIQQLQAQNAEQAEKIKQLEAERDAAVACLKKAANEKGECFGCKWYNGKNCTNPDYKMLCSSHDDKWEWRGVTKEE